MPDQVSQSRVRPSLQQPVQEHPVALVCGHLGGGRGISYCLATTLIVLGGKIHSNWGSRHFFTLCLVS